jgi:hypothetical protein
MTTSDWVQDLTLLGFRVPGTANANAISIEHIKLENEGWERDTGVTEPVEPTLSSVAT